MNNSRLKRALSGFLSVAMLIMCMPLVGISAGALDSTTQVLLMAQGGVFTDGSASKNITLTSDNKMPAGTLDEEPTKDGYVFGYWSTYRKLDEGGSTLDRVTEDYVFTDANINGSNIQIDANWYNPCTEISVSGEVQIYNGYALPKAAETLETPFTVGKNDSVKPSTAEWYYITKGTEFDITNATKYTSGDSDTDTYDYYIVMTLDISGTFYRFNGVPKFDTKDIAPAKAIEFNRDTIAFAWKAVPYEMITEITDISINPDVTASGYTLSAGDFPTEFTGSVKGTTKSGKTVTMDSLAMCLWYEAGKVGGENRPAGTAEDGKAYVPGFVFMPPEKCYAASSEVMAGMENAKVSASLSAAGYGVDPVEGLVLITGPEITVGAGSSSDPLHDNPIVYLEDVTVEPADGDTTGTSFVFKNIPQLTEQETAAGFAYVYSIQSTKDILPPDVMAEDYNSPIRLGTKTPSESSLYADVCNDIPDDLKITVTEESMIIFAKVNKTDPNYRQTIDEDSAYFVLAAKAIPVTPTAASDPLLDTPIAYLEDVTVELADDDTTGTTFVFKNVPQLTEEEVAAGFEYVYSVQPTGSASPDDIADQFNEVIAEEDTKPAESTIDVNLCIDLPKDLKITVDANSIIFFAKVNRKNPSYLETSAEGSAYYTFAQKVIAVTPGVSDPLLDTPITYLKDVTVELADDDTTGTSFVFKNVPQLTEEEVAAGFEYVYSLDATGSASPKDIADQFNEVIAEEDTKPAESTIEESLCTALPKDLKITVKENSIIFFAKVNRTNPAYRASSPDGTEYYTFAQKVIAVEPGKKTTSAELAADKIDKALDDLKPTNNTVKSDVQSIVDKNKDDTTAVITTFKLTPATEDTEGSLNIVITVTDAENNVEIVEKTYVIDKITASGEIIVDNDDNVGEAGIDPKEAKNAVELTPEEQALLDSGEDLYIILNVKNADNTVPADDKALVEAVLNGKTVGMYLDITLFKMIAAQQTAITTTKTPVTITFDMPADLINTDSGMTREYSIIRVHNGKAEILKCTFDPATGKASFMTDKFSSYAIAYQDSAKKPSAPSPVNPVRPGRPDRPAPSDPTTPDKPASDPTTPDKPSPSDPSTPDKPSTSDEPVEPSSPSFDEKLVVTAQTGRRTITLSWNEIENADGYVVYRLKHGKYVKVKTVSGTSVTFGGLINNKTYKYIVKYTMNGEICPDELSDNASGKIYYKPAPTAKAGADSVTLKWKAVPGAVEYEVYTYIDGKAVKLTKTNERSVVISGLNSNTEYQYIVRAYVNDKWTVMREADIVTVTTKA